MRKRILLAFGLLAAILPSLAAADEVDTHTEGGYRITRRVVKRPMSKTEIVEQEREVYREQLTTEIQETTRVVQVPVTQYQWEHEMVNRWNPFSRPYMIQRLVPRTHWETRTEIVSVPVTQRRLVPETQIVQVPVTRRWMADEEIVSKVAINPIEGESAGSLARKPSIGGTKLDSDPPKSGTLAPRRY
jgi:hypothetical protein